MASNVISLFTGEEIDTLPDVLHTIQNVVQAFETGDEEGTYHVNEMKQELLDMSVYELKLLADEIVRLRLETKLAREYGDRLYVHIENYKKEFENLKRIVKQQTGIDLSC